MKKWMALLLAVWMMFAGASALANEALRVVDEVAFAVNDEQNDRAQIFIVLEVENTSNEVRSLGYQSTFSVVHRNGKEYSDGAFLSMYPQSIGPGQKGYVIPSTYALTAFKTYEDVADYNYDLVSAIPTYFTCDLYETALEQHNGEPHIKLTNPTNEILYDVGLVTVYRGEGGELMHVDFSYLYDYGIPAGMSAYVNVKPQKQVRDFFDANGIAYHASESFAYVTTY